MFGDVWGPLRERLAHPCRNYGSTSPLSAKAYVVALRLGPKGAMKENLQNPPNQTGFHTWAPGALCSPLE